jgi:hypothetical protein
MGRGAVKIHQASYDPSVAGLRDAMSHNDFDDAWAEGAALTTAEHQLRAARSRRTQTRVQRLGVSHPGRIRCRPVGHRRAWQQGHRCTTLLLTSDRASHLTHAYTKLGLTPHVQLAQEQHATLTQAFLSGAIVHYRTVLGSATKMRKTRPPS